MGSGGLWWVLVGSVVCSGAFWLLLMCSRGFWLVLVHSVWCVLILVRSDSFWFVPMSAAGLVDSGGFW
jgi:hypothetical protein